MPTGTGMTPIKSIFLALPLCLAAACGGGQTSKLQTASGAPAAVGNVETSQGENGNTVVKVEVEHLAPPENVASGASVYVVWAKPRSDEGPRNLGALKVSDDRKGKLETKTPLQQFELLVTPEASPLATKPTGEPVMRASVQPK